MLGFSAGGHLTVMSGSHYEKNLQKVDKKDDLSARLKFLAPIYPAYLGDKVDKTRLSEKVLINKNTPPTFYCHYYMMVTVLIMPLYCMPLSKNNVIGEIHIHSKGGHGYGLRKSNNPVHTWPDRCRDWFDSMGYLKKISKLAPHFAASRIASGVMKSSFMTVSPGALIPKRSMPMTWP